MREELVASIDLERWKLSGLHPHPRNPRKHPKPGSPHWEVLKVSLRRDYFDPLVVNRQNGMLVSGHLRLKVLQEMGYTEADVSVVDYDEHTHLARLIAANQLLGEFEQEILTALAAEIEAAGLDSSLAGLTEKELTALLEPPTLDDDTAQTEQLMSKADELQGRWQVQPGDLYEIGSHRLLCGDCASPDNWQLLLRGVLADMTWIDPPYNVDYEGVQEKRNEQKRRQGKSSKIKPQAILNDSLPEREYAAKLKTWLATAANNMKPGGAIYVAHADCYGLQTRVAAHESGFYIAQCLVWVKNGFTMGRQDYQWQHEPVLYGWKPGAAHYWGGGYRQATVIDDEPTLLKKSKPELVRLVNQLRNERDTTVIREARNVGNGLHPTVKPIGLVARQIWSSSRRGETVQELFCGSGTTLAAAEHTGRRCVATELDPKYCAVILERMSALGLTIEKQHA